MEEGNIRDRLREVKHCLYCGRKLKNRLGSKYCSPSHKTQAYKQRKKLKDKELEIERKKQEAIKKQAYENQTEQQKATDRYLVALERRGF